MKLNSKGFSLIELMVVVAIIAILATIAVPSYTGFTAKARQKEGLGLLSAYHQAASATFAEVGFYPGNFVATGFRPQGQLTYRLTAMNNAASTVQFGSSDPVCFITANPCNSVVASFKTWEEVTNGGIGPVGAGVAAVTTNGAFTVHVSAMILSSGTMNDIYSMDQNKMLTPVSDGLSE